MSVPTKTASYFVTGKDGFDSLELKKDVDIPRLGEYDCLVKVEAVSLNYRDLIIPKGMYPFPVDLPVVPCSDGAGSVVAVGDKVSDFSVGDRVCTLFNQEHQSGPLTGKAIASGLGGAVDGTLREFGVFPQHGLVKAPSNLSAAELGTLTCAPLTAWNALYGLESKALRQGDTVLIQGTGGVSISALQFAVAAGAVVIGTSSSKEKCELLSKMGAKHTINYKEEANWGEKAKSLTPQGEGVDHVIEIGGPNTMAQSLKAVKLEGVISVIGFIGGADGGSEQPSTLDALNYICTIRGILVGSRAQFTAMNHAIEANDIHPVVDKVFDFEKAKEAYQYQWDQKHVGKVVIKVDG